MVATQQKRDLGSSKDYIKKETSIVSSNGFENFICQVKFLISFEKSVLMVFLPKKNFTEVTFLFPRNANFTTHTRKMSLTFSSIVPHF